MPIRRAAGLPSSIAPESTKCRSRRSLIKNNRSQPRIDSDEKFVWGEGSDNVSILEEKSAEQEAAELRAAKEWKATEFDAGFGWITGPEEYGGRALPTAYERAYREVASQYALTSTGASIARVRRDSIPPGPHNLDSI